MVIFVSGPMTGKPDYNRPAFFDAEKRLTKDGHIVWNPAHFPDGLSHEAYMQVCEAMIDRSDAIYQLPGWKESRGARHEYGYAYATGKKIVKRSEL